MNAKLQTLKAALSVIENCQATGQVTVESITPVSSAIALGINPPAVLPGRKPLEQRDCDAPAGTWPHFAAVLARAVETEFDGQANKAKAEELKKAGKAAEAERLEKVNNFHRFIFSAIRQAIFAGMKAEEAEIRRAAAEAKAQAEAERKAAEAERKAAEAKLSDEAKAKLEAERAAVEAAKQAKKAAVASLLSAASYNDAKPQQATPRPERKPEAKPVVDKSAHKRLSVERVRELLGNAVKRNVDEGASKSEATKFAATWVLGIILKDASQYTPAEVESFKNEVGAKAHETFYKESKSLDVADSETATLMVETRRSAPKGKAEAKPEREDQPKGRKQPRRERSEHHDAAGHVRPGQGLRRCAKLDYEARMKREYSELEARGAAEREAAAAAEAPSSSEATA